MCGDERAEKHATYEEIDTDIMGNFSEGENCSCHSNEVRRYQINWGLGCF